MKLDMVRVISVALALWASACGQEIVCPIDFVYDEPLNLCVCREGFVLSDDGNACLCQLPASRSDAGLCVGGDQDAAVDAAVDARDASVPDTGMDADDDVGVDSCVPGDENEPTETQGLTL